MLAFGVSHKQQHLAVPHPQEEAHPSTARRQVQVAGPQTLSPNLHLRCQMTGLKLLSMTILLGPTS